MDIIITNDIVSMRDIDRLEAIVRVNGGMVADNGREYEEILALERRRTGVSYGLLEDLERAQVIGTDGDYDG